MQCVAAGNGIQRSDIGRIKIFGIIGHHKSGCFSCYVRYYGYIQLYFSFENKQETDMLLPSQMAIYQV